MARTTSADVQATLLGDYDADDAPSLATFITSASLLVDQVAVCAENKGLEDVSDAFLADLEKWLAAHFYASVDSAKRPLQEKKTLSAMGKFQGMTGMRLDSTYYGQTALTLDWTGCLLAISKGNRVRAIWLGLRPSEQTDYEDRS